mgnify:CR=1 FL=1
MRIVRGTKPQGTVIPLDRVKKFLRITGTDQDQVITQMINAAVDIIEQETWIVLQSRSYTLYMDDWYYERGLDHILIKKYPVTAVNSVKYYDASNVQQTLTDYYTSIQGEHARVYIQSEPTVYDDRFDAIEIAFTAGYASWQAIPDEFIELLQVVVFDLYEERSTGVIGTNTDTYKGVVSRLMDNYSKRIFS